jgi:hypothetical protein
MTTPKLFGHIESAAPGHADGNLRDDIALLAIRLQKPKAMR